MKILLGLCMLLISSCSLVGKNGVEEPTYTVIEKENDFELREYKPLITASVQVKKSGDYKEDRNIAFRKLADYIFGGNQASNKIKMTAPVIVDEKVDEESSDASQKIAMTAPVIMDESNNVMMTMSFVMPSQYTIETLPTPNNQEIQFQQMPAKTYAVLRFSGLSGKDKIDAKTSELMTIMKSKNIKGIGNSKFAGYDPPWTIPFFRRNEVMIEVRKLKENK